MRRGLVIMAGLVLLGACVERAPELSPADRERLREHVGTEAPNPQHELNVRFDHGVRLLGYDLSAQRATPGQPLTVTWHWYATEDLDDGWQIFTHVADGAGENRLNQDRVGVVRELYQPGRWEAGQYIEDRQEVTIPSDWNSDEAVFYLGLWNGPHRLAVRSGPNDGDNRVRALTLEVAGGPSAAADRPNAPRPAAPPTLEIPRLDGELEIDGQLDEEAWSGAARTAAFVDTMSGAAAPFPATARAMWDDEHLYVAFEVTDDFVQNTHDARDDHLWEQDAVEIMLDPGGDGRNYFELQVSPSGIAFDTRYDTRRQPQPFGHVDWNADLRAAAHVRGTANDAQPDEGWSAEIAIPWAAFAVGEPPAARPAAGDTWRMNLYVMDQRSGDGADRAAAWSPPMTGDFHVPNRFGAVTFAAPAVAAAEPEVAPQGRPANVVPSQMLSPRAQAALREQIGRQRAGAVPPARR